MRFLKMMVYVRKVSWLKKMIFMGICLVIFVFLFAWILGSVFIAPERSIVGESPIELGTKKLAIKASDGVQIESWFADSGKIGKTIILCHGVHGSRLDMISRAKWLSGMGFSVFLFDFRAHGESGGDKKAFGYLESQDVDAAYEYVKNNKPLDKIFLLGQSMGAAAIAFSHVGKDVDGIIFEQMYSDLNGAIKNKIEKRIGKLFRPFSWFLSWQIPIRFGVSIDKLSPLHSVAELKCNKLFVVGESDVDVKLNESMDIFENAASPKHIRIIKNAGHVDLFNFDKIEYEDAIREFLNNGS